MSTSPDPELGRLIALGARVGADRLLVQGAGGNVSIKDRDILWIKASGTWLMNALRQDLMVPVRLEPLLAALARNDPACETCVPFVAAELNAGNLRPSIETTMHAILPQRIVVHVHCVETIAWACLAECAEAIRPLLNGLDWAFVPYARPGLPLTRAIAAVHRPGLQVLVLGNHGLTVAADTVDEADALLGEVQRRLRRPARALPSVVPDLATRAGGTTYRPAASAFVHGVALDPHSLAVARSGSLYPDHVIFLGPGIVEAGPRESAAPMLVVPGAGVLMYAEATPGAVALAGCLADVTARLNLSKRLVTLSAADEAALTGWDAEKYRQGLDRKPT